MKDCEALSLSLTSSMSKYLIFFLYAKEEYIQFFYSEEDL